MILWGLLLGWTVRGPEGTATGRELDATDLFAPDTPAVGLDTDVAALARVAADTARFLRAHPEDPAAAGSILESLAKDAPTPADRLRTLDHLAKGGALELAGFRAWRWTPDAEGARAAKLVLTDRIR
ncbi:MAG: hypothetical protein R3F61_14475, partial [Myxococcota bacterium]